MIRVHILVEGQTEESFVRELSEDIAWSVVSHGDAVGSDSCGVSTF